MLGTLVGLAVASRQTAEARPTAIAQFRRPEPTARAAGQDGRLAGRPALVGFVLDVNGNEITVKSREGPVGRVIVGPNTDVRRRRQRIRVTDVREGDPIVALGRINQQRAMQARLVVVDPPRPILDRLGSMPSSSWGSQGQVIGRGRAGRPSSSGERERSGSRMLPYRPL
ncbi:MAG TPA: hypothetical protein VG370_07690 [Chloroflexota bacterium]|nr:hypothetical protein [Chloroflexota bacterium]